MAGTQPFAVFHQRVVLQATAFKIQFFYVGFVVVCRCGNLSCFRYSQGKMRRLTCVSPREKEMAECRRAEVLFSSTENPPPPLPIPPGTESLNVSAATPFCPLKNEKLRGIDPTRNN